MDMFFFPWTQYVSSEVRTEFFYLDVMLRFVSNYVHVIGEKFVPSSLHATENNIKNITFSTHFLESFCPLICQKRQRSDFNRQIVSIESFEFVILCLHSLDSFEFVILCLHSLDCFEFVILCLHSLDCFEFVILCLHSLDSFRPGFLLTLRLLMSYIYIYIYIYI